MSLVDKSTHTFELSLRALQSVQDAGFNAATAVAEKVPGLPGPVASRAARVSSTWVSSYFQFAERVLTAERHAAENWVGLNNAYISPRRRSEKEAPLKAA